MQRLALLLGLVVWSPLALAQVSTGTISGTVADGTGAVLPGTTVSILNERTGISRTIQADSAGRYSAALLNTGNYRVTASLEGFQTMVRSGIELTVGREAVVNFQLQVGAVTQTLEVTGEAPLVESTTSSIGGLVDERTILELPLNARSWDKLALLQPGVTAYAQGGSSFSVAGGRAASNSFLLDGTDINDVNNETPGGASGTNMGVDTVQEFKILTNMFSAEYGRSMSAVVTAVTKSGSNEFHGTAFHYLRNSALDARDFFDRGSDPPPFKRNQFGAVIGGPIRRDKAFFFAAYEGLRERRGTTQIAVVPNVSAREGILPYATVAVNPAIKPFLTLWPIPNGRDFADGTGEFLSSPSRKIDQNYWLGRVDYQLTAGTSLMGRYNRDVSSDTNPDSIPNFESTNETPRSYSTLQAISIITPTLLNTARFAVNRSHIRTDSLPTIALGPEFSFVPGLPMGQMQIGTAYQNQPRQIAAIGTGLTAPRVYLYTLFDWSDDLNYVKGRHTLKFGTNIKRVRHNGAVNTSVRGGYAFESLPDMLTGIPANFEATPIGQDAYRGFRQSTFAMYGQDDVRVSPRLTLNLGLRWEFSTGPTEANGKVSNIRSVLDPTLTILDRYFEISKKNIQPRIGLAWQLNDKGTTVVRAGFGIFHNLILPDVYHNDIGKLPPFYSLLVVQQPQFPGAYSQIAGGRAGLPRLITLEPFLKTPTKNHYTLSVQQQILKNTVVEISYVGAKASNIWRKYEANTPYPQILPDGRKFFAGPRRNPLYDSVRMSSTDTNALYNGFLATLRRRSGTGLRYQISYTFSRSLDHQSGTYSNTAYRDPSTVLDPEDLRRSWGLASIDARHNLVVNYGYPLPFRFDQKALSFLLSGWEISGIGTWTTGSPFSPRIGSNNSRNGDLINPDRPDLNPGASNNPIHGTTAGCGTIRAGEKLQTADRWYDPCAFSRPLPGTYGNLGRNTVTGPGLVSVDMSLMKMFKPREGVDVQFRGEFFNILNHANFNLPNVVAITGTGAYSGSAARVTATRASARQIQFALRLIF